MSKSSRSNKARPLHAQTKSAHHSNDDDESSGVEMSDISTSKKSRRSRPPQYSTPVDPGAVLFDFSYGKNKKKKLEMSDWSSGDEERRLRSSHSQERVSNGGEGGKRAETKRKGASKIPTRYVQEDREPVKGKVKARAIEFSESDEEEERGKNNNYSRAREEIVSPSRPKTVAKRTSGKGPGKADTVSRESHKAKESNVRNGNDSDRRRTYTTKTSSKPLFSDFEETSDSSIQNDIDQPTNARHRPSSSAVRPTIPTEVPKRTSGVNVATFQKPEVRRTRAGPASKTNKTSVRQEFEPDSLRVQNLQGSRSGEEDEEEQQNVAPVHPFVIDSRRVSALEDIVRNSSGFFPNVGSSTPRGLIGEYPEPSRSLSQNALVELAGKTFACLLDKDVENYQKMGNAASGTNYVEIPINSSGIKFSFPQHLTWVELFPGVNSALTADFGKLRTGYLRLDPMTVKPLEKTKKGILLMSVIEGKVTAKSTSYSFNDLGHPYLNSVELFEGCSMSAAPETMYSLENWSEEEVSLHWTVLQGEVS